MSFSKRFRQSAALSVFSCSMVVLMSGCQLAKNQLQYDRAAEMDRQDYRDVMAPAPFAETPVAPAPDFEPVLATPQELRLPSPLVTVSVNQTVGLRDLLFELAEQAEIDLELDPQIRGSIIFTAKDRPFDEVVNRICEMAGLRYRFDNNILRVERDRPYVETYKIDYLNLERKSSSSIKTKVSSSSSGGTETSGTSGSDTSIENKFAPDLWAEIETNIEQILTSSDTFVSLATTSDPVSTPINPAPPPPAVVPEDPSQPAPPPLPGSAQVAAMPPAVAPTLNISPALSSGPVVPNPPATYSVSRQTGLVTVFASERQQRMVSAYLERLRRIAATQILIEAKVLEVSLTDEFASGIDWGTFNLTGLSEVAMSFPGAALNPPAGGAAFGAVLKPGSDLNVTMRAMSRFGTVRALSSPRVTVLNNQPAVVNVAENRVFFDLEPTTTTSDSAGSSTTTTTFEVTRNSVPEGVLLNVVPTANPDTGEIFMAVRPTVTKITDFAVDPSISLTLAANGINPSTAGVTDNLVPNVSIQEMDSLVRLQSGQIIVMGGLMKDQNMVSETGVPVLGDLPYLGKLFKRGSDTIQKSELVILLRAQIVPGSNLDEMDRKLYRSFSLDRRPAAL